jgi:hypothetical protein
MNTESRTMPASRRSARSSVPRSGVRAAMAAAVAVLVACAPGTGETDTPGRYSSPQFGFTFEYPDTLDLREYTPEFVALGRADGDAFEAAVEIAIEAGEGESFEAFATERARLACAADGPDRSLQCTEVEALQPIAAEGGTEGLVFHLRHVATRPGTDEVIERGGRGPFFVYDISPRVAAPRGALFVRAPVALRPDEVDTRLVRQIATSVRMR